MGKQKTLKVVGVLEKVEWDGSVGGPLKMTAYVSQENATHLKAAQQSTLKTSMIQSLGFWVAGYDQETKSWFEQFYPLSAQTVTGVITGKDNPELNVDLTPVPVKDGIDVNVYKVSISVAPGANKAYTLNFANSSHAKTVKAWGLEIGKLAK
jgi:hypothetical protein